MEDIKEIKENVKEVLTKVEEAFGNAGKTLFPNEEPKNDRDLIRYVVKAMAMEACFKEHVALQECMRRNWFSICHRKQKEYWDCYRKETIRLRKHYDVYWDK